MKDLLNKTHKPSWQQFLNNPFMVIFSAILIFLLADFFSAFILYNLNFDLDKLTNKTLFVYSVIKITVFIGLILFAKTILKFNWGSIGIKKINFKSLAEVVPALFIYFIGSTLLTYILMAAVPGFDVDQAQDVGFKTSPQILQLVFIGLSLVIITPIIEEILFRGILFKGLRRKLPFWFAAVITSTIFALAHGQWNVAADTFILSLVLCYLVERSGSVISAILLHAVKNLVAFILLFVLQ